MQEVQLRDRDISGQEQVHRLSLTHVRLPVCGMIHQPPLIKLKRGLIDFLLIGSKEVKMLHGATVGDDRTPNLRGVLPFLLQQFLEEFVLHEECSGLGLLSVGIGSERFDARRGTPADD